MPGRYAVIAALVLGLAALVPGAWGDTNNKANAVPGTVNYVEGSASIGSEALDSKSVGSAQLKNGQSLTTDNGKVEILLTPGVFLRLGNSSAVRMVSSGLTNTGVELDQGQAIVEVDEIHPENNLHIATATSDTKLLKTGLYDFDLRSGQLMVFDGKASIRVGDQQATVKSGHEVSLENASSKLKSHGFDKKEYQDSDLYRWSSLRSAYLAEANANAGGLYAQSGSGPWGPGWWGAGWYWDPYFSAFTFIPGDGIFYSPFGWGFYSPWWAYASPFWGYGGWYGYHPVYHHFSPNFHNWGPGNHYIGSPAYAHGIYRGPGSSGGFHSGSRGFASGGGFGHAGGGFHGGGGGHLGGGGFHGGGGGFHGR